MLTRSMVQRVAATASFEEAIRTILNDVIALQGSEFGNVQLAAGDELVIVDQRGFFGPILTTFRRVRKDDDSACGQAIRHGRQIIISDVETDQSYAHFRKDALAAGYRAVQSTPLFTSSGSLLGVVSTHFTLPHTPTSIEMQTLREYSTPAADFAYLLLKGMALGRANEQQALHPFLLKRAARRPPRTLGHKRALALHSALLVL